MGQLRRAPQLVWIFRQATTPLRARQRLLSARPSYCTPPPSLSGRQSCRCVLRIVAYPRPCTVSCSTSLPPHRRTTAPPHPPLLPLKQPHVTHSMLLHLTLLLASTLVPSCGSSFASRATDGGFARAESRSATNLSLALGMGRSLQSTAATPGGCLPQPGAAYYSAPAYTFNADGFISGSVASVSNAAGATFAYTSPCVGMAAQAGTRKLAVVEIDFGFVPRPGSTLMVNTCGTSPSTADTVLWVGLGCPTNWTVR